MNKGANYYEVLGVERAADERAIKKAYFALVRQYPPETHPEEFQRIREAYEVLSNKEARRAYDSTDQFAEYGEQFSALMKAASEAMNANEHDKAQALLLSILEQKPDLYAARDMLGMSLLRAQKFEAALKEFNRLIGEQPEKPLYLLHRAYVHHAQKKYPAAMQSYEAALKLNPNDIPTLVSTADCLTAMGMYDGALMHLDKAINLDGQVDLNDFGMLMRRLEIQFLRNRSDLADREMERIVSILPPNDPDARKYVASRLASLAADMFALHRSQDANRLLKKSRELDPKGTHAEFPIKVKLRIDELPEKSQGWLKNEAAEPSRYKLKGSPYAWPVVGLLCFGAWYGISLLTMLDNRRIWDSDYKAYLFLTLVGAPVMIAWCVRAFLRVRKSPYKKFTTVHPLYLLQVNLDEVVAWPFANLQEVFVTHHSTNGVYTNSIVRLKFPNTNTNVSIRGQNAAVEWANHVLARRRRVLELLASGLLEGEEGFDFIPGDQLRTDLARQTPTDWKSTLQIYGGAAAAGLLMFLAALPWNHFMAQDSYWADANYNPSLVGYQKFLDEFPHSRHADEARQKMSAIYDKAIQNFRAKANPARPGVDTMVALLNALKASGTTNVRVTFDAKNEFSKANARGVMSPLDAFSGTALHAREQEVIRALNDALGAAIGPDVMRFVFDKKVESPVEVHIAFTSKLGSDVYRSMSGRQAVYGLKFDWDVSYKFADGKTPSYEFQAESEPSELVASQATRYASDSKLLPYEKLSESAFNDFARQFAWDVGVLVPDGFETRGNFAMDGE